MPTISRNQPPRKQLDQPRDCLSNLEAIARRGKHQGISLRPYQRECPSSIAGARSRGITRELVVQATGLGKPVQAANVLSALNVPRGKPCLFLASPTSGGKGHALSRELVAQRS